MRKQSKFATRNPGARSFVDFVEWCVSSKGSCGEPEVLAWICDTYKREYVIRYAAKDAARQAIHTQNSGTHHAIRFLEGTEISDQEAERLYSRGAVRLLNDHRSSSCKSKGVAYCKQTKTFVPLKSKEPDAVTC